jgi:hypothetical protein
MTPLQDIIKYAYEAYGIEYSFALLAAIEHGVKLNPEQIRKLYGSWAVTGLRKFQEQLTKDGEENENHDQEKQ